MTPSFKNDTDELRSFDFELRALENEENGSYL